MTRLRLLPAVAALLLLLPGCAAPLVPAVPAGDGGRPQARTDATCDDLAPADRFDAFFRDHLELVGPDRTDEHDGGPLPEAWLVRQAGGVACDWMGPTSVFEPQLADDFEGVTLRLLPATEDDWAAFRGGDGLEPDYGCGPLLCWLDAFTPNGWWLDLVGIGMPEESEYPVTAVFEQILATVAELPPPTDLEPPHSGDAVSPQCDQQIESARVARATGAERVEVEREDGVELADVALAAVGGTTCRWSTASGARLAEVRVLPGGAWAMEAAAAADPSAEEVVVRGHESAGILRDHGGAGVDLDLAVDGDWVRIMVWDPAQFAQPVREVATALGIALVHAASD